MAYLTYLADWVGTKLRWGLTVDRTERDALRQVVVECPDVPINSEPV
ncbi:hypothetical protein [Streptomyces sp. N2A]|nr:hypothetical protein [Streptomyces sp. N2A]